MNENLREREFLGQGLAFPLQLDQRGGIALARGERDIEQAIRIILGTMPGERKMRPEFGCHVYELAFEDRSAATYELIDRYVRDALAFWEPRITVTGVGIEEDDGDDGVVMVDIAYEVNDTHNMRSLVYPFYIVPEGGAPEGAESQGR